MLYMTEDIVPLVSKIGFHPQFKTNFQKLIKDMSSDDKSNLEKRLKNSINSFIKKGLKGLAFISSNKINNRTISVYEQCLMNNDYYNIYLYLFEEKKKILILDIGYPEGKTSILLPKL